MIIGDNWEDVQKSRKFFEERHCFIDCRGRLVVARSSVWGFNICVYTASHNISRGFVEEMLAREVVVRPHAWIASSVILYNCFIGDGAVVSVGSVVANMTVPPHTMVEGNPAKIIKKFENGQWSKVDHDVLSNQFDV